MTTTVFMNQELLDTATLVAGPDYPLSLGRRIYLLSDSYFFNEGVRVDREHFLNSLGEHTDYPAGLHAAWDNPHKMTILYINSQDADSSLTRFIELVVHECSHLVDELFTATNLVNIDTELRAYTLDWIVGKVLCQSRVGHIIPAQLDGLMNTIKLEVTE